MPRSLIPFNLTPAELEKMFSGSNVVTVKHWEKRWLENVHENLQTLCPTQDTQPRKLKELWGAITKHVSLVLGAGPSLRRLRRWAPQIPSHWGIVCVDHALSLVLECGLQPTVVVTMDGHQETEPVIQEGFEKLRELYPETPVVVDWVCCPTVVRLVERPYMFRTGMEGSHVVMKYLHLNVPDISQIGHGGNVGSVAVLISRFLMYSEHVVLLGLESSFKEGTRRHQYHYDGREAGDEHAFVETCDIYGRPIMTMANLFNYKWWLDHFCHQQDDVEWINANQGGFLGVASPQENFDHFKYMSLGSAIEHIQREHPNGEDY